MGINERLSAALAQSGAYRIELGGPPRRACPLTHGNGPVFYSLGAASLLEAMAPSYIEHALARFAEDQAFCTWLKTVWGPQHAARVTTLRHYITITWPEFDWSAAKEKFAIKRVFLAATNPRATVLQDALAGCVAVSQAAVFYRCLSRWADDERLRELARLMAFQDGLSFDSFRNLYDALSCRTRIGTRASWRTILSSVRKARDVYVQDAFDVLVAQWGPNQPFVPLTYPEFAQRVAGAISMHVDLDWPQRMIFKGWKDTPRALVPTVERRGNNRAFKPVLPREERGPASHARVPRRWRP